MKHRIAFTDALTGQTHYTDEMADSHSAQHHHLEVSCDQNQLIADGESQVILNFSLLDGLNHPVKNSRTCGVRIHNTTYKIQLDENGEAVVPLKAKTPGQITIEAVDPPGGVFFIDAVIPPQTLKSLDEIELHQGPITFEG
jgi:hypothetical protein